MSDSEENEQMARAIALSLQGLETRISQEERENLDLKNAIAASLGKTVEQLTARDILLADTTPQPAITNNKRPREEETNTARPHVIRRFDYSNQQFWNGIVKLTYVKGFVGQSYIRFQDIIQKVLTFYKGTDAFTNHKIGQA